MPGDDVNLATNISGYIFHTPDVLFWKGEEKNISARITFTKSKKCDILILHSQAGGRNTAQRDANANHWRIPGFFFCVCVFWKGLFGRNPKYQISENRANLVQNMNQTSAWNVENQFSKCADINIRNAQFVVKGTVHPDADGKSGKFRSPRNIHGASQQNSSAAFTSGVIQVCGIPEIQNQIRFWGLGICRMRYKKPFYVFFSPCLLQLNLWIVPLNNLNKQIPRKVL